VLLGGPKGPEGNWPTTKLREPAFELGLGSVMRKTGHMQDLAAFRQKGADISSGVHRTSEHIRVLVTRLGLANQATENTGKGDGFLHGTTGRGGSKSLQVERQVVLDGCTGLDGLHLKGSTYISQGRRPKWKRFGMVLLPSLVLGTQIESPGVLEIRRENDRLVSGFPRKLDTEIPGLKGDEDKFEVLRRQMLGSEGIETVDGVPEGSSIPNVLPGQSGQARW